MDSPSKGWGSLYKTGAALFLASGVSTLIFGVFENFYEFAGFCPTTCIFQDGVKYVGDNANLFYAADIFLMLAVLLAVPAVVALFVALKETNAGLSALGASFAILGCGMIVAYLPELFYLVQEAQIYVTGTGATTVFNLNPLNATAGLGVTYTANDLGFLLILLGVLVLGVVMFMSAAFGRTLGTLGILAALVGLVGTSIYPTGGGTDAQIVSMLTYVLIMLWNVLTAWKLVRSGTLPHT